MKNNRINVPQSFPFAFKQIYSNIERCYLIILDNIIILLKCVKHVCLQSLKLFC